MLATSGNSVRCWGEEERGPEPAASGRAAGSKEGALWTNEDGLLPQVLHCNHAHSSSTIALDTQSAVTVDMITFDLIDKTYYKIIKDCSLSPTGASTQITPRLPYPYPHSLLLPLPINGSLTIITLKAFGLQTVDTMLKPIKVINVLLMADSIFFI